MSAKADRGSKERVTWFQGGEGNGDSNLGGKAAQQLLGIANEPMFQVFLYVHKAYNYPDRGRCMDILRGYEIFPKMARLLAHHWENQQIGPKVGIFLGKVFGTGRGVYARKPRPPP